MIAADWDVFVASIDVVDLISEMPGGRRDRAMRAVHEARKREIYHPLGEDDWAQALVEAGEWNQREAARKRAERIENLRRRERAAINRAARAASPRGHAA
ncbi:hypothetical protein GA0004736_3392 [Curtobacterium sp. 9128]|uniref:hypothetical protein n=1 Tax=Curtobacterium sp. 9128 TaxID=1793722 RepID=UPI0007D71E5A|nr:hypothetical protein [Curtobacterium sp. 9128]SBN64432.1 hypothetical protein GA0004736_3392 [Curtobacterium sp. 9128]